MEDTRLQAMNKFIGITTSVFVGILPLLYNRNGILGRESILFYTLFLAIIALELLIIQTTKKKYPQESYYKDRFRVKLTYTDLAISGYVMWSLLNVALITHFRVDSLIIWRWITIILAYTLFRLLLKKKVILYGIVISGMVQSLIAISQKLWFIESNHRLFDVTGSFGNPGQLGGYLAICFVVSVCLIRRHKRWHQILFSFSTIIIGAGLLLSDSRASWLGALFGVGMLALKTILLWIKKYKVSSLEFAAIIVVIGSIFLYQYRPGSADSRLLIWRVSANMVADKPIVGHGINSFGEKYMLYQADYFKTDTNRRFIMSADNTAYPYNEFIHITIEQGIIGLILLLLMISTSLIGNSSNTLNSFFRAPLIALMIFSAFSYPTDIFPLLFMFPLLLGNIDNKPILQFSPNKWSLAFIGSSLIAIALFGLNSITFYRNTSIQLRDLQKKDNADAIAYCGNNYQQLISNHRFNLIYLRWLGEHSLNLLDADKIDRIIPYSETYCILGDFYRRIGMHGKAEEAYKRAALMIPTRLRPNYNLWKLYLEIGDTINAIKISNTILSQPLKVENTYTISAKVEIRNFLESNYPK